MERTGLDLSVREIMEFVRSGKDLALMSLSEKFDGTRPGNISVTPEELKESDLLVPDSLKRSIGSAAENIRKFHAAQLSDDMPVDMGAGIRCWRKSVPIQKVGLYIPGGSAPLFSTVLMLGIPAKIAGCSEIVLCTPPGKNGKINPVILYTAKSIGINSIFKAGGAQAIAAMAFGTETVPKVFKIFGPGNQYVTKAKELGQAEGLAIDMPAGPSEVLVMADENADPSFIASDLLSQAEHGPDSQVMFLTVSRDLINRVKDEIGKQLDELPRRDIAAKALSNSMMIQLSSLDECVAFSNAYAPEHLIINTRDPHMQAAGIQNAGSVFLGPYSCESAGDYASGTNHTLPTNGYAMNYSGVSVDSFIKKITFQEISQDGLKTLGPVIEEMAGAEFLAAHKNAVSIRLKNIRND